ncbi:hypothetical protein ACCT25_35055, partial [Rhizobium ruizarguesonis]
MITTALPVSEGLKVLASPIRLSSPEKVMSPFSSLSRSLVAELSQCIGHRVKLQGFVEAIRDQKRM